MSQSMRVAICGLGERISHVARTFARSNGRYQYVGYCDPLESPNGLPIFADCGLSPGPRYSSLDAMLVATRPDLLMVGSPNDQHLVHIQSGLEGGARVFSEKPLVTTEEETFALLRLLARHGRDSVIVGLVLRYSPLYRDFRRLQDEGVLGDIVSLEGSENLGLAHGAFLMRDWRRHESTSGGYLLEKCCHDLDLYQGLAGARPRLLSSFGGRRTFIPANRGLEAHPVYDAWHGAWDRARSAFCGDGDIVDFQAAMIQYENGATLAFSTNLHAADKTRRICALGTRGMIEGDFERNYVVAFDAQSGAQVYRTSYDFNPMDGHYGAEALMAGDIAAHLFDGADLPVTALDALEAGLTAIKLDEARRTSTVIDMAECWSRFDASFGAKATDPKQ